MVLLAVDHPLLGSTGGDPRRFPGPYSSPWVGSSGERLCLGQRIPPILRALSTPATLCNSCRCFATHRYAGSRNRHRREHQQLPPMRGPAPQKGVGRWCSGREFAGLQIDTSLPSATARDSPTLVAMSVEAHVGPAHGSALARIRGDVWSVAAVPLHVPSFRRLSLVGSSMRLESKVGGIWADEPIDPGRPPRDRRGV